MNLLVGSLDKDGCLPLHQYVKVVGISTIRYDLGERREPFVLEILAALRSLIGVGIEEMVLPGEADQGLDHPLIAVGRINFNQIVKHLLSETLVRCVFEELLGKLETAVGLLAMFGKLQSYLLECLLNACF